MERVETEDPTKEGLCNPLGSAENLKQLRSRVEQDTVQVDTQHSSNVQHGVHTCVSACVSLYMCVCVCVCMCVCVFFSKPQGPDHVWQDWSPLKEAPRDHCLNLGR